MQKLIGSCSWQYLHTKPNVSYLEKSYFQHKIKRQNKNFNIKYYLCVHYNHKYYLVEILASLIIYKRKKATLWTKGNYIYIVQHYHVRKIKLKNSKLSKGRQRSVHFQSLRSGLVTGKTETGDLMGYIIRAC